MNSRVEWFGKGADNEPVTMLHPTTTPIPPHAGQGPDGPLSAAHLEVMEEARARGKKVRRAAVVAAMSGWTLAIFAGLTLLGGVFGDWVALGLGAALGVIAFNELRGARMLRRYEPRGARLLGFNQLVLAGMLVVYGAGMMAWTVTHPMMGSGGQSTGDAQMDAMIGDLSRLVGLGLYGGVMVAGLLGPGLTAWYYFSREKVVRRFVEETPGWVVGAMRAVG